MELFRGSKPRRIYSGPPFVVFAAAVVGVLGTGASMELHAQALPDALQSFTGYTKQGDQTMVSPDGFFVLSSSDDAALAADGYGAYFAAAGTTHGPAGLAQFMEIRANPASGLGTFQLQTMVVGDGIVGPSHHRGIQVSGLLDGTVVAQTQMYESATAEANWPLDYSSFAGQQLDLIRVAFVVVDGTPREDFNLESFTVDQAQAAASPPTVTTASATDVTKTSATLGGAVTSEGDEPVTSKGVVWSTSTAPTVSDSVASMGSGAGSFSASVSGFTPGTQIHVRAFATSAVGTVYGSEVVFTTAALTPPGATTPTSPADDAVGVARRPELTWQAATGAESYDVVLSATGDLSSPIVNASGILETAYSLSSDLDLGTEYFWRVRAVNEDGAGAWSATMSFTTEVLSPTVTTGAVSAVSSASATVAGEVTADGGASVTARGVVYATSPDPTLSDGVVASGSGMGAFSAELSGLASGTTYHVRAYATNAMGTGYGDEVTLQVDRLTQTITFEALAERVYGDESVALEATASSGLEVALVSNDESVARIEDGRLVIAGAGTATITASQAGDDTYMAAAVVERELTVAPRPVTGSFTIQTPKTYDGDTDAEVTSRALAGVSPADDGQVALEGGVATFADAELGTGKTVSLTGATLSGPRAAHYTLTTVETTTGSIVTGAPHTIRLEGPSELVAGQAGTYTLTLLDAFGNPTTTPDALTFAPKTSLGTGGGAFEPTSVTLTAGGASGTFTYTPVTTGSEPETLAVEQTAGPALDGGALPTTEATVSAAEVDRFDVEVDASTADGGATVGVGVVIRITARDAFGNLVPSFEGMVDVTSGTELGSGGGMTAPFVGGVLEAHEVVFDGTGPTTLTASVEVEGRTVTGTSESFHTRFADAQLSIDIEADDERPAIGSEITLRVVVTNLGWAVAGDVAIDAPLADQQRLEPLEVTVDEGVVDTETGAWRIDALESGASATMTIRARVVAP